MPPSSARRAQIHIARKALALTEDAYRDMLRLNFDAESSNELTDRQAAELIDLFRAKGWRPKRSPAAKSGSDRRRYIEIKPGPAARQQRKVLALWHALGYEMAKLNARTKTQFDVDRIEWLTDGQALHILITDLEARLRQQRRKK